MTTWYPIKTAPKDGTEILLCQATNADKKPITDAFGIFCQVAAWWADENGGNGEWIVYCSLSQEPRLHFEPTHWARLPTNPLLQEEPEDPNELCRALTEKELSAAVNMWLTYVRPILHGGN